MERLWGECGTLVYIEISVEIFLSPPDPPHHDDGDKVTTRDAHCGLHNKHLKKGGSLQI